jgi:hypothetical protein
VIGSVNGVHDAADGVGLAERPGQEIAKRPVGDAAERTEETPVVEEERPQALGDGEDVLAMLDAVEQIVLEPVGPDREPLGVAGRTG